MKGKWVFVSTYGSGSEKKEEEGNKRSVWKRCMKNNKIILLGNLNKFRGSSGVVWSSGC